MTNIVHTTAPLLVLSDTHVRQLLTMESCIAVMEDALAALARGEVHQPLRQAIRAPGAAGLLGLMPSYRSDDPPFYGLKEVCVFPGNPAHGLDTHLGAVLLHSGRTGELLGAMNASAITEIRTAAVSAVATRVLARPDARALAIIGGGVQARSHLEAIPLVRPIEAIRIVSRTRAKAEALAQLDERVRVYDSVAEAVDGADVIVTATSSRDPILDESMVAPGAHINAVGSSIAAARELTGRLVARSSLFVDRRESTLNESGDYLFAVREGLIDESHIRAELGEVLEGTARGRVAEDEITLFKSLGLGIEDLAAAAFLYEEAKRTGVGTWVDF